MGVLGGGQLGRMLALAGHPLGLRLRCLDPSNAPPAAAAAEIVTGAFDDPAALMRFVSGVELVTFEFENLPAESVRWLADHAPVLPPLTALSIGQDRLEEKTLFKKLGIAVPEFAPIDRREDLEREAARIGLPAVLKTRRFGYDGKGQVVLRAVADLDPAWQRLGGGPLILERFVSFEREVSLLAVRSKRGEERFYPLVENVHRDGILAVSRVRPSEDPDPREAEAREIGRRLLDALEYVGVLAVELFEVQGRLLANEIAPRVHNSGHWTIEGAATSQFENHLRAILGWPLGSTRVDHFVAMVNLIGGTPPPERVLALESAHLHLYGKEAAPGRKLGHVTLVAKDRSALERRIAELVQLSANETPQAGG
ncbi:MAG: 5-(carboxyamino)imidazole ribonucleotide synthase [Deltaproteobacteria bacterium]|nr:5-(carboxyamino)imidazole ribonucleotide synthase [Deltaproteobacteria bacterium]